MDEGEEGTRVVPGVLDDTRAEVATSIVVESSGREPVDDEDEDRVDVRLLPKRGIKREAVWEERKQRTC
jgi:hypothetical protein